MIISSAPATQSRSDGAEAAAPPFELCFAPGTPTHVVERHYRTTPWAETRTSLNDPRPSRARLKPRFQFSDGNRWSTTASNGCCLGQGAPTTLTWSVVPDGTTIPGSAGEPTSASQLHARLNAIYGNEAVWLTIIDEVFFNWSELTGISYVYEPNDDGASFPGSGGVLGVRGDVRIAGHPIDGSYGILAYNFFPNTGDMVLDVPDSFYNNTSNNSRGLRNVLAHEHGHGLGLSHVCPINQTKLMEPFISFAFSGPQHDDILAAQRGYGDSHEHNDAPGTAKLLGSPESVTLSQLSIDDNSDVDYLRLTVGGGLLDVAVEPLGASYLSGAQNPGGSCSAGSAFNTLAIHDLALRVLSSNGENVLYTIDAHGVGEGEALIDAPLAAGNYLIEVSGDATNQVQLYSLTLTQTSNGDMIFQHGFEGGSTSGWSDTVPSL